ncbi:MAG: hypothetical protein ITG02_13640 [Patulibacter sp.]|nr:hypothetical protein [Patulibacter sp.]
MSTESNRLELSVTFGANDFSAAGDASVVTSLYHDFKQAIQTVGAPALSAEPPTTDRNVEQQSATQEASDPAVVKAPTKLPLKPYLDRLKLRGNKEKAAAIVAWSAESGGKASLTIAEIEALWKRDAPFRLPSNLGRDVRAAKSEGWLDSDGADKSPNTTYSVNGYGEGVIGGWAKSEG